MSSIVGTPVRVDNGGSYTAESGSNRVVVWIGGATDTVVDRTLDSATFGAANMEVIHYENGPDPGNVGYTYIAILRESAIIGGAQTLTATWSDAMSTQTGMCFTLQDVDQTTPWVALVNQVTTLGSLAGQLVSGNISAPDNSVGLSAISLSFNGAVSTPTDWTELHDVGASGSRQQVCSIAVTSAATLNATHTFSTSAEGSGVWIVFQSPAGGVSIIPKIMHHRRMMANA